MLVEENLSYQCIVSQLSMTENWKLKKKNLKIKNLSYQRGCLSMTKFEIENWKVTKKKLSIEKSFLSAELSLHDKNWNCKLKKWLKNWQIFPISGVVSQLSMTVRQRALDPWRRGRNHRDINICSVLKFHWISSEKNVLEDFSFVGSDGFHAKH